MFYYDPDALRQDVLEHTIYIHREDTPEDKNPHKTFEIYIPEEDLERWRRNKERLQQEARQREEAKKKAAEEAQRKAREQAMKAEAEAAQKCKSFPSADEIIAQNAIRNAQLKEAMAYDPVSGTGAAGPRRPYDPQIPGLGVVNIPIAMLDDPKLLAAKSFNDWIKLRCRYDFEFWAVTCVKIRDKTTGLDIPFRLNAPQRRVLATLEQMRLADKPLRLIMLKARQWGGSTLIQVYMAWIQTCLCQNWNSLICAHVKDTAATIRGMYTKLLDNYPEPYWPGDAKPCFKPFERSTNIRVIAGRDCRVTIASAENQDAVRGMDISMAHLSEVAFWRDTAGQNPEGFIRAICGAINSNPLTLIALESTANGVGNYFHSEWLRSVSRQSDKTAIFVPWHEIEIYRRSVTDPRDLIDAMDQYERDLWLRGLTLEMIAWYHDKRREYPSHAQMMAEYPTTPEEAFRNTSRPVFSPEAVERMRAQCRQPLAVGELSSTANPCRPDLKSPRFVHDSRGNLKLWEFPQPGARYTVAVDIGGRSEASDWSVIAVIRDSPTPTVAAQWRGHCDHDHLAWNAATVARFFNNALLIFESNTLESENSDIEGDPAEFILTRVSMSYPNLYRRQGGKIGFHTNRSTKTMIISNMVSMVRDSAYIERDNAALNELVTYRASPSGAYAASPGNHDDMLMARAIALFIIAEDSALDPLRSEAATYLASPLPP